MSAPLDLLPLMEAYEVVAKDSRDLLAAARASNWNEFDRIQSRCRAHVAEIRSNAGLREFSADQQRRRREILVGILGDDRAIRDILEPTTRSFDALMQMRPQREGSVA